MPNHVHIQLHQTEANLSEAMKELFGRFASRQNRKYQRKGHLFGGPYRQAVCLDDIYAMSVSLYIHLNPVRAGLADDPQKYRWSSCALYCREEQPESFLCTGKILGQLSQDHHKAIDLYKKSLFEAMGIEIGEVLEDQEAIHRFQASMAKLPVFKNILRFFIKDASNKDSQKIMSDYDLVRTINELAEKQSIQLPKEKAARRYLIEQLLSRGYTQKEIARRLNISRKTIYNIIKAPLPISGQTGFG